EPRSFFEVFLWIVVLFVPALLVARLVGGGARVRGGGGRGPPPPPPLAPSLVLIGSLLFCRRRRRPPCRCYWHSQRSHRWTSFPCWPRLLPCFHAGSLRRSHHRLS